MRAAARATVVLVLGGLLGGCALFATELRTTEGPAAEEIWKVAFRAFNGRSPSFDEIRTFEDSMDLRIREYLAGNFEAASAPRVGYLRFWRKVAVGMTKEEVTLLLGKPPEVTADPARMKVLARKFWPEVSARAKEAWSYPAGWTLYFDGNTLADVTRYHHASLLSSPSR